MYSNIYLKEAASIAVGTQVYLFFVSSVSCRAPFQCRQSDHVRDPEAYPPMISHVLSRRLVDGGFTQI